MKINELDLLSFQTQFMKSDTVTQGFCAAINPQMINIANNINKTLLWKNYRNLSEQVLDAMALDLNILWYDSEADYEVKAYIVEKSDEVRLFQGTAKGIKLVFEAWNVTIYILEWFNYGGDPYHYKIVIDYSYYERLYDVNGEPILDVNGEQIYTLLETPFLPDGPLISKLTNLLQYLQPARCILDSITTTSDVLQNTYADVEASGTYENLTNRFYWDLQYQI